MPLGGEDFADWGPRINDDLQRQPCLKSWARHCKMNFSLNRVFHRHGLLLDHNHICGACTVESKFRRVLSYPSAIGICRRMWQNLWCDMAFYIASGAMNMRIARQSQSVWKLNKPRQLRLACWRCDMEVENLSLNQNIDICFCRCKGKGVVAVAWPAERPRSEAAPCMQASLQNVKTTITCS